MPKFLAVWQQVGGCDYTIGCGIRVEEIEAPTIDHVRAQVLDHFAAPGGDDEGNDSIESVVIYPLQGEIKMLLDEAQLGSARARRDEARKERDAKSRDNRERAEFDRLKKKFGS